MKKRYFNKWDGLFILLSGFFLISIILLGLIYGFKRCLAVCVIFVVVLIEYLAYLLDKI